MLVTSLVSLHNSVHVARVARVLVGRYTGDTGKQIHTGVVSSSSAYLVSRCDPGGLLSNLLSARLLLSHSIEDAARDGPCAHGNW